MTNGEKFKDVFGFGVDGSRVIAVNSTWWDCEFLAEDAAVTKIKGYLSDLFKIKVSDIVWVGANNYILKEHDKLYLYKAEIIKFDGRDYLVFKCKDEDEDDLYVNMMPIDFLE